MTCSAGLRSRAAPVVLLSVLLLAVGLAVSAPTRGAAEPTKPELELAKLKAEGAQARAEAAKVKRDDSDTWRAFGILAPMLTAIIAAGGLFATVKKNLDDREKERIDRRDTRDKERQDRLTAEKDAEVKRFDERFAAAAAAAAGAQVAQRRSGAVLLGSMVSGSSDLSDQAINLLFALLQAEETETDAGTTRLLVRALGRALKTTATTVPLAERFFFTHLRAPDFDMSGLDLTAVDLAFSQFQDIDLRGATLERSESVELVIPRARLERARLSHCQWFRLDANHAKFQEATLVESQLRHANLSRADFFKARLPGADLRGANLRGAKFQQADLTRARFRGVGIDDPAIATVVKARGWREAEWDAAVLTKLEALDSETPA